MAAPSIRIVSHAATLPNGAHRRQHRCSHWPPLRDATMHTVHLRAVERESRNVAAPQPHIRKHNTRSIMLRHSRSVQSHSSFFVYRNVRLVIGGPLGTWSTHATNVRMRIARDKLAHILHCSDHVIPPFPQFVECRRRSAQP